MNEGSDIQDTFTERLFESARGFQESRIVLTAVELGVFDAVGEGRTAGEVSAVLKSDPRATEMLLNALAAMKLLVKEADTFRNTAEGGRCLTAGSPDSYLAALKHAAHLWPEWSRLTEIVKPGASPPSAAIPEDEWRQAFIGAMHVFAREQAPMVADLLDLSGVRRLLDLGGGPGTYAIEFARKNPGLRAVVLDLPEVVPIAERVIADSGLSDRVTTKAGDYAHDDLGSGYDLAFLSSIIHSNSAEDNRLLARRTYEALAPGGRIVIRDFVMEESRIEPAGGAVFAINMLVATRSGTTYTEAEATSWLSEAGFEEIARQPIDGPTSLIIGRKKG